MVSNGVLLAQGQLVPVHMLLFSGGELQMVCCKMPMVLHFGEGQHQSLTPMHHSLPKMAWRNWGGGEQVLMTMHS